MRPRRSRPTLAEQETVIRWDREDPLVHIWTASPTEMRRLAQKGLASTRETNSGGRVTGRWYVIPRREFRWGLKRQGARLSPEHARALQAGRRPAAGTGESHTSRDAVRTNAPDPES